MIKLEKSYKEIHVSLEIIYAGKDMASIITGGHKAHIGSISIFSKDEGIKTISLNEHKDYIISELFINTLKDCFEGTISVSCGIHLDNITKSQINDVLYVCQSLFEKFKNNYIVKT